MAGKSYSELDFQTLLHLLTRLGSSDSALSFLSLAELRDLQQALMLAVNADVLDVSTLIKLLQPSGAVTFDEAESLAFTLKNTAERLLALTEVAGSVEMQLESLQERTAEHGTSETHENGTADRQTRDNGGAGDPRLKTTLLELQEIKENAEAIVFSCKSLAEFNAAGSE
jgi:hypothetical protein